MRLLQLKPRHAIARLALSPDGTRVVVGQPGHGVRVIETLTGADVRHLPEPVGRTRSRTLVSPTGRYTAVVSEPEVWFAETAAGVTEFRFQAGWRRAWDRDSPPDDPVLVPVDAAGRGASLTLSSHGPDQSLVVSPCALSGDHQYAVGRSAAHRERVVLFDLARGFAYGQFSNARGFGITFHATFTPSNHVVIGDMRGISVYPMLPDFAQAPTAPPEADPPKPQRGAIGRFVHALFGSGPQSMRRHFPAALAPRPVPMLEPWATVVPTTPQPDTEIPPFALLPCGRRMLVRGEKSRVELRDVATGEVITVWKWGLPRVRALAVSGNGLLAAAAGAKGQLMLWDLE